MACTQRTLLVSALFRVSLFASETRFRLRNPLWDGAVAYSSPVLGRVGAGTPVTGGPVAKVQRTAIGVQELYAHKPKPGLCGPPVLLVHSA